MTNKNAKNYEVHFPNPPLAVLGEHFFPTANLTLRFVKEMIAGITPFKFEDLLVSKPHDNSFALSESEAWVESLEELERLASEEKFKVELCSKTQENAIDKFEQDFNNAENVAEGLKNAFDNLPKDFLKNDWNECDYKLAGMAVLEVNDYIKASGLNPNSITRKATLHTAGKEIPLTFEELVAIYKLETKSE